MRQFQRVIDDAFHERIGGTAMTWYGAEFSQDCLPYNSGATQALTLTHPSKPYDNLADLEREFWGKYIQDYKAKFLDTSSSDFIVESACSDHTVECISSAGRINDLPVEILGRILGFAAVPSSSMNFGGELRDRPRLMYKIDLSALFLGQVCSYWRNIVRTMPTLWSTIRIYRPRWPHASLTKLYLLRSGPTAPLTLSLHHSWQPSSEYHQQYLILHTILSAFVAQIHRWRGINLTIPSLGRSSPLLDCSRVKPGAAKILESLHLMPMSQETGWARFLFSRLATSPVLHDISFGELRLLPGFTFWPRITHLILSYTLPVTFEPVLSHLQELQVLAYRFGYADDTILPSMRPEAPIVLPKLHTLDFEFGSGPNILAYITTPALKTLRILYVGSAHDPSKIQFREFLDRSQCALMSFTLSAPDVPARTHERMVVKWITTPGLKSVEVLRIKMGVGNVVVALLAMGLFPSLKELLLPRCETRDGIVGSMVQRKMEGDKSLGLPTIQMVKIGFIRRRNYHDEVTIKSMRKDGHKVTMMV
ncbi:hypothetical protein AX16_007195, partial [Volvariella volvacea WC 439]